MSVLSLEVSFLSFSMEGHFFFLISVTWLSPAPATCGLQSRLPCQDSLDCWQFFEGTSHRSTLPQFSSWYPTPWAPSRLPLPRSFMVWSVLRLQWKTWELSWKCRPRSKPLSLSTLLLDRSWRHELRILHTVGDLLQSQGLDPQTTILSARASIHLPSQLQCVEIYTAFSRLQF